MATGEEAEVETETTETAEMTETNMTETVPLVLSRWQKVVALVQAAFQEGRLAEEATWKAVVLIPKGGWYYRIICLV